MKLILVVNGGTTNLRVSAVDEATREVLAEAKAEGGVKHTAIDGHNQRLKNLLKDCVERVLAETNCASDDVERCIAFGMITSNMGLLEIPHLVAPVSKEDLRAGIKRAIFPEIAPFEIEFIPGVRNFSGSVDSVNCSSMDMMRGEETEAIGLYELLGVSGSALFVMPGSHNKFVRMDDAGRIDGCMTSISGEMLDAFTHNTILADAVKRDFCSAETYDSRLAVCGARECAASGLGRAAFAGRILTTLGDTPTEGVQSWLLGAILMEDVRAMETFLRGEKDVPVFVAGKPPVQTAFCDVLEAMSGTEVTPLDPSLNTLMSIRGALTIADC